MPFRCSFRLEQRAGDKLAGWSQNFWNSSDDLTVVRAACQALQPFMFAITGVETAIPSVRISDPKNFRRVKTDPFPLSVSANPSTVSNESGYPSDAVLLKLEAAGPYITLQWLRGIFDQVIGQGGKYLPGKKSGFTTDMAAFLSQLTTTAQGWSIRGLNRAILPKPITSLAAPTGIITVPNHGFGSGGTIIKIRVKGFAIPRGVNRLWKATVIDANSVQLNFYYPPSVSVIPYGEEPSARLQDYSYTAIQVASIVRATSHYTGKPLGLLGGRRRSRRRSPGGLPVDV